jgi:hypothetical protein
VECRYLASMPFAQASGVRTSLSTFGQVEAKSGMISTNERSRLEAADASRGQNCGRFGVMTPAAC